MTNTATTTPGLKAKGVNTYATGSARAMGWADILNDEALEDLAERIVAVTRQDQSPLHEALPKSEYEYALRKQLRDPDAFDMNAFADGWVTTMIIFLHKRGYVEIGDEHA